VLFGGRDPRGGKLAKTRSRTALTDIWLLNHSCIANDARVAIARLRTWAWTACQGSARSLLASFRQRCLRRLCIDLDAVKTSQRNEDLAISACFQQRKAITFYRPIIPQWPDSSLSAHLA